MVANPVLSVTVTNYNYARWLPRVFDSILGQSFGDFELIVVDNASTDDSLAIIRQYAERDRRFRLITHAENQGLARSLAEAGAAARGRYHVHIDADDWVLDSTAFERQIAMLENDRSISAVFSPLVLCDESGKTNVYNAFPYNRVESGEVAIAQALMGKIINTGPMMRTEAFRSFGGYNTSFLYAIDVKLAIDLCGAGRIGYINKPLYAFYQHPNSLTHTSGIAAKQRELVRAVESAFSGPLQGKIAHPHQLRQQALGHMLTLHAVQYIFGGNPRAGWAAIASAARIRPFATFAQAQILRLLLRTLLGRSGYWHLRSLLRRETLPSSSPTYDAPDVMYALRLRR